MTQILHIDSSIFGADGTSSQLAAEFVDELRARDPEAVVIRRDLGTEPLPHLDAETFGAFTTAEDQRTPRQAELVARSDALVGELWAADVIVLGVPMYNFQVPSQLKAWFDHVARAGVTFQYTENGPEGFLKDKRAYVFAARGGIYGDADTQTPYIRQFLGFLGITDVTVRHAEGLAMGEEAREQGLAAARGDLAELSRQAA
jgi:FMN-dependent NADH-azoreductase